MSPLGTMPPREGPSAPPPACALRAATALDLDALARLWHDAWHDAHDGVVPEPLGRARTPEQFTTRMEGLLPRVTLAETEAGILGFCAVKGKEVEHLFVEARFRGRGVARALMKDGLGKIAAQGAQFAHLFCLHGNRKGMRFYDRTGWQRTGLELDRIAVPGGRVTLRSLRYERAL